MDLRRIRHFTILAEILNFSRAAERLHMAQPALSVSIQKLETELGTKLFERTSMGVTLTASGAASLLEARRMLYHGEQMKRAASDVAEGTGGRLRIGFVGSAIQRLIPELIPVFRSRYPAVELVLREGTSNRIMEMLSEEALDIGIVRTPLLQATTATLITLQRDRFMAAVPLTHRLAHQQRVSLTTLRDEAFVMYSATDASGLHSCAMSVCQAAGFIPDISQEASQISTVVALVECGLGVALVPEVMRLRNDLRLAYLELDDLADSMQTALALACMPGVETIAAQRFVDLAKMRSVD